MQTFIPGTTQAMPSPLLVFYGKDCPHCEKMEPLVRKLERDIRMSVTRLDIWKNKAHEQYLETLSPLFAKYSGYIGLPAFVNLSTNETLIGEVPYLTLQEWARIYQY